jgi:hypothetical protein
MTTKPQLGQRRLRATLIGLGLDGRDRPMRIITGQDCLVFGGSAETHSEMLETLLRLECELERIGQRLGDVEPDELAEIAWRIDSPELHAIALRLEDGLEDRGQCFAEADASELTALASGADPR